MCGLDLGAWYGGIITLCLGLYCVYVGLSKSRQAEARQVLLDAREQELNRRARETEKRALRRFKAKFSEWLQFEENQ